MLEQNQVAENTFYRSNLVPHAPYSISPQSFRMINELTEQQVISMHNQETPGEDELYKSGGGDFLRFFGFFTAPVSPMPVTGTFQHPVRTALFYTATNIAADP